MLTYVSPCWHIIMSLRHLPPLMLAYSKFSKLACCWACQQSCCLECQHVVMQHASMLDVGMSVCSIHVGTSAACMSGFMSSAQLDVSTSAYWNVAGFMAYWQVCIACQHACWHIGMYASMLACLHISMLAYWNAWQHVGLSACQAACWHAYQFTFWHAGIMSACWHVTHHHFKMTSTCWHVSMQAPLQNLRGFVHLQIVLFLAHLDLASQLYHYHCVIRQISG